VAVSAPRPLVRAVLFDLDDTLFDHQYAARAALQAVRACHECFMAVAFEDLDRAHARFLEEMHHEVMLGRIPLDEARRERFGRLFGAMGVEADASLAGVAAARYRERYQAARRAIDGAAILLPLIRSRARVGVVSNNLLEEQREKLRHCGLDGFVDALVVSEEAGVSKPDPLIFRLALDRLGCEAGEAVMIGDSWAADVAGARAAGIRAIWFNPSGGDRRDPAVPLLKALRPPDEAMRMIFDADRD
jgi:HAD superfamily hydrolase (TIGR01549 family)